MDATILTATGQHGATREVNTVSGVQKQKKVYSAAQTVGAVYNITNGTYGPTLTAIATDAVAAEVCVALSTETTAAWRWVAVEGFAEALVEGTTDVAVSAYLEVLNAESAFKLDHATTKSVYTAAIAIDAVTAAGPALATVYLLGSPSAVAAT